MTKTQIKELSRSNGYMVLSEQICWQISHPKLSGLDTVFHFTPAKVMKSKAYLDWMESLPSTVTHIGINENSRGYQVWSLNQF